MTNVRYIVAVLITKNLEYTTRSRILIILRDVIVLCDSLISLYWVGLYQWCALQLIVSVCVILGDHEKTGTLIPFIVTRTYQSLSSPKPQLFFQHF